MDRKPRAGELSALADVRALARLIAEEVIVLLEQRGTLVATGISSRNRKEVAACRDEVSPTQGSSDPTAIVADGESSWSMAEADRIIRAMELKRQRDK
jgi:hypothetical protein